MKQIIKITVLLAIISMSAGTVMSQEALHLNLDYNMAMPMGSSFRDYISNNSFRGWQGSLLYDINSHFRVGLQSSYNDFYQKYPRQLYKTTDGSDVSTVLSNQLQVVPVLAKGEYSFLNKGLLRPYIGLGAGVNFISYYQYQGLYGYNTEYSKAAISGELGVLIPLVKSADRFGLRVGTSYNYLPFNEEGIRNLNTWNIHAGLSIPIR